MFCVPTSYASYRSGSMDSFRQSNSRRTSATSTKDDGLTFDLIDIDEDYGHYCGEIDIEQDALEFSNDSDDSNWTHPSENSGMMCSGSADIFEDAQAKIGAGIVSHEIKDEDAPLNCRFFPAEGMGLSVSIIGARLIEGLPHAPRETEYHLRVMVNGVPKFSVWRRYYHFECLAEACNEYSFENPEIGMPAATDMRRSSQAWQAVQQFRANIFQITGSHFLNTECTLITKYIKYLLFEAPHSEIIIGFIDD